jgi:hypothetical protein
MMNLRSGLADDAKLLRDIVEVDLRYDGVIRREFSMMRRPTERESPKLVAYLARFRVLDATQQEIELSFSIHGRHFCGLMW